MVAGLRKTIWVFGALVGIAVLAVLMRPNPVPVETAEVVVGPLQVTIDEDAETRARDRFVISAPVSGRVERTELHEGDMVERNQVVAELWPLPLSAREREEQLARIAAAEALADEAGERARRVEAEYEQAGRERERMESLAEEGLVSKQEAEQAQVVETTKAKELEAARFRARSAEADVRAARAALLAMEGPGSESATIPIRSPVEGRVLRIPERSERIVEAGEPLITIGDPRRLEVVIDLLSTEAVKVRPGMPVLLEGWGGSRTLRARVRVVEPYGFTKVSALGVEEQRVNVIADFLDPAGPLGDAYRVEARIVTWAGDEVLKVPVSALFRYGDSWAVFTVEKGRARRHEVEVGHRGALEAEIVKGLEQGDIVIRHPSNELEDGTRVKPIERI